MPEQRGLFKVEPAGIGRNYVAGIIRRTKVALSNSESDAGDSAWRTTLEKPLP